MPSRLGPIVKLDPAISTATIFARSGGREVARSLPALKTVGAAITAVIYARGFAQPMVIAMAIAATVTLAGAFASGFRKVPKL